MEKRIDAMNFTMFKNGITEKSVQDIVMKDNPIININTDKTTELNPIDFVVLKGAILRMSQDFSKYRADIIQVFALDDSRIISTIKSEDFMKQLFTVTDTVTKTDLKVIIIIIIIILLLFYYYNLIVYKHIKNILLISRTYYYFYIYYYNL